MRSERGQATVEWVGLVLLVALVLGFVVTRAREAGEDERGVGDLLAQRIASGGGALGEGAAAFGEGGGRAPPERGAGSAPSGRRIGGAPAPRLEAGAIPPLLPLRGRELLRVGARRVVAANGLVCYLRKSTAGDDTNRVGDDIGDAVNCLNPVGGWTGEVGGTDD
jgi:hypothetical protein